MAKPWGNLEYSKLNTLSSKQLKTAIHAALKAGELVMNMRQAGETEQTKIAKNALLEIQNELQVFDFPIAPKAEGEKNRWWNIKAAESLTNNGTNTENFAIYIALMDKEQPILGVIYSPEQKALYFHNKTGAYSVENVSVTNLYEVDLSATQLPSVNYMPTIKF